MKLGDRVRVKKLANLPDSEKPYRNRIGTVAANSGPGEVVLVDFDDEAIQHQFLAEDLEQI
jgi:hypothetical protein